MKGGALYDEADLNNTILINGTYYIRDKDNPNEPLMDIINLKKIPATQAVLLNKQIYNIYKIYKWVIEYKHDMCPLRNMVSKEDKKRIDEMYKMLLRQTQKITKSNILTMFRDRVKISESNGAATFGDNISRGDLFILQDERGTTRVLYSTTWYLSDIPCYIIFCTTDLKNKTKTKSFMPKQVFGYVLQHETEYFNYLVKLIADN